MLSERRHPDCLNCGSPTPGEYCGTCGQRNTDLHASMGELVLDLLGEAFEADSRIARTVGPFLLKPGFLTAEHNAGRRVRYSSPLRLYLFCSFAYFLALSLASDRLVGVKVGSEEVQQAPNPAPSAPEPELHGLRAIPQRFKRRSQEFTRFSPEEKRAFVLKLRAAFVENMPKAVFVLLPAFALLLKLLYWRTRRFYVEHLTFAFHLHAFAFVVLLAMLGVELAGSKSLGDALFLVVLFYGYRALRTVYGGGRAATLGKAAVLSVVYLALVSLVLGATAAVEFLVV